MRIIVLALALAAWPLLACPMFVEFFPDPTDVSDFDGEYVEIRFDDFRSDSLYVSLDGKSAIPFAYPRGANRMVLVHDTAFCPSRDSLACGLLGSFSLPNSRESVWSLQAGSCLDTAALPVPKAGKALQRVGETDEWAFSAGTFGVADADYELGIRDCGLALRSAIGGDGNGWRLRGILTGCDSAQVALRTLEMGAAGGWKSESLWVSGNFEILVESKGSLQVQIVLPEDAAPANDTLDTLLVNPGEPPALLTEIHHCPEEPMPEWVEVYNGSRHALPLSQMSFCGRGKVWGGALDSLSAHETILVTKDTAGLRAELGFKDVRILYAAMGFLNNTAGNIAVCFDESPIDSASWDKNTVSCPSGFDPRWSKPENTPGYQNPGRNNKSSDPFTYKFSSRVVSKKGRPLRVAVESESEVSLQLLDSAGHGVWKTRVAPMNTGWTEVPATSRCKIGVCYVSVSVGSFEKVVGIVVRP